MRWPRQAGFTLLETLVALLVLGLVVAGLAQGLRFGLGAWDRQARAIDRDGALDATDRTLRHLLAGMAPGSDPRAPSIVGTADRLTFIAKLPMGAQAAPIRLSDVAIGLDGAHRLILRWTPHLHVQSFVPPAPRQAVLLTDVAALRFAYYRPPSGGQAAGWVDIWQAIDPPILVRVHIAFSDAARHWPDLIVAPMRQRDDE